MSSLYLPSDAVEMLSKDTEIAFDIETTGLSPWKNDIAIIQFMGNNTQTPIIVRCRNGNIPNVLYELFTPDKTFVGHNITTFDLLFFGMNGVPWQKANYYDTLTGECIINTTSRRDVSKSLKESVRRRLGIAIDKDIAHGNWTTEELSDEQLNYALEDVKHLLKLKHTQETKAKETGQAAALQFEMDIIKSMVQMTLNGLPLCQTTLDTWINELKNDIKFSEHTLYELFGKINLNSPKQLINACKEKGVYLPNTAKDTLIELELYGNDKERKLASLILEYRIPAQRLKMYSEKWQKEHIVYGFIHPRFQSAATDTLRMSSSNPNIQQVPADGRKIIGGLSGYSIVWVDYSQIEIRIAAEIAQDKPLINILKDEDVHTSVAAEIFNVPEEIVSQDQRRAAKAMTFLLLFGGGAHTLYKYIRAQGGDPTEQVVNNMFDKFFAAFGGLKSMRTKAYSMAQRNKIVQLTLPNGAKRILVGDKKIPPVILNTIVQGTAALGMKKALQLCFENNLTKYMGAAVHDEIVSVVPNNEVEEFIHELSALMIKGMNDILPNMLVKVEGKYNDNWGK